MKSISKILNLLMINNILVVVDYQNKIIMKSGKDPFVNKS